MNERPNPDALLAALTSSEAAARRGRLKIFFGANAGVGKTYTMLEAARAAQVAGEDIVAAYIEAHGRADTDRVAQGLEVMPSLLVRVQGIVRRELDLDAVLARHPQTALVDELAHSNLVNGDPPMRHTKRWQDIQELLDAGINVWTTVNVQHLESLNDLVAGITGIRQSETVPDRIFDEADEVELIDLPPEELLARLHAGKLYGEDRGRDAAAGFFSPPNLLALRELALRRTADRVDAQARELGPAAGGARPWLARDRFLVAVKVNAQAEALVRLGKRFAGALDADWVVVTVETPIDVRRRSDRARETRSKILRLAEDLGAETVTLQGADVAGALLEYAKLRTVSRIVVGQPRLSTWRHLFGRSVTNRLIHGASEIDISIIGRRNVTRTAAAAERSSRRVGGLGQWRKHALALCVSAGATALAWLMYPYFELTNLVMVYLLGATIVAYRLGRGPASLAAVVNVVLFDFFFVPPRFTMDVADAQYLVTFAVMLVIALTIAALVADVRAQSRVSAARERRTGLLYGMTRELAAESQLATINQIGIRHVAEIFSADLSILLLDANKGLVERHGTMEVDVSVAHWAQSHNQPAGFGTDTLPGAALQYRPLRGAHAVIGVAVLKFQDSRRMDSPEQRALLETILSQISLAIERAQMNEAAEAAQVAAETENLRNTLLASISHDLRGPLAVITSASGALLDSEVVLGDERRRELLISIEDKSQEMTHLVRDVLDLVRLESGTIEPQLDWYDLDDLVRASLEQMGTRLVGYPVSVHVPKGLPAVRLDEMMLLQVLRNLLENVVLHTPRGTPVMIGAEVGSAGFELWVEDHGPGLPPGDPEHLFEKFQRGRAEGHRGGAGLGLAICKTIATLHHGVIRAQAVEPSGVRVRVALPRQELAAT